LETADGAAAAARRVRLRISNSHVAYTALGAVEGSPVSVDGLQQTALMDGGCMMRGGEAEMRLSSQRR
jgi:hypothetical protein